MTDMEKQRRFSEASCDSVRLSAKLFQSIGYVTFTECLQEIANKNKQDMQV